LIPAIKVCDDYDGQFEQSAPPVEDGQANNEHVCRAPQILVLKERVQQSSVVVQAHEEQDETINCKYIQFVAIFRFYWLAKIGF
jgi:hypothetical protein